eukprot:CAMPEP_0171915962 /NCGR_PEP_ID=MMETSP0993-20121228/14431_1 /TAXON_ID=483369 /ORGANISM="non described non described, Strain CCMP2098" /LENGTH=57 /DNA_ID=CAMNT_0012551211 /DNA_START=21 /DNA_END=194 /DNA_ORIENTATION=+
MGRATKDADNVEDAASSSEQTDEVLCARAVALEVGDLGTVTGRGFTLVLMPTPERLA